MKYKKHIVTGALALTLLVSGSNVFAATPQDLGIKTQQVYQKQSKSLKTVNIARGNAVGTISSISNNGFTVDIKNIKTKSTSSIDITVDESTTYSKNGIESNSSSLSMGQKVIVVGMLDKTTNILAAKTVKIATS